jgi:hypothetical protein
LEALPDIKTGIPSPLPGIDSDNGPECINRSPLSWRGANRTAFTRTRPYKKNGSCFVEQKNLKCVRDSVGCSRFGTPAELAALAAACRSLRPLFNYFLPAVKLVGKTRVGAKVRKAYGRQQSPCRRLPASPGLSDKVKAELKRRYQSCNPALLRQEVRRAVGVLTDQNRRKVLMRQQPLAAAALEPI